MDRSILQRLQRLEHRRTELSGPVDGLSASLWEYGRELAGLDALGRMLEADALGIAPEDLDSMASSYVPLLLR